MKILALDIATQMGVAVGTAGGTPIAWSVDLGKGRSDDAKFSKVLAITSKLLAEHNPDIVAIEAPVGGPKTSHYLVGLCACVRGCAANRGVKADLHNIATIRKHFTGKAWRVKDFPGLSQSKSKMAIKGKVLERCRILGWDVPDHDAADAAALFDYAGAMAGAQVSPPGEMLN